MSDDRRRKLYGIVCGQADCSYAWIEDAAEELRAEYKRRGREDLLADLEMNLNLTRRHRGYRSSTATSSPPTPPPPSAPQSKIDRERLAKILGMMGSTHEGERQAAAEAANRMLKETGMTWEEVIGEAKGLMKR